MTRCCWCNDAIKDKDIIAVNRKLVAEDTNVFYCLPCMAENFGCTEEDIKDKIAQFKEEGCTLFS